MDLQITGETGDVETVGAASRTRPSGCCGAADDIETITALFAVDTPAPNA
jgi:hypothetical protein